MADKACHYRGYVIVPMEHGRWCIEGKLAREYWYKYRTLSDAKDTINRYCGVATSNVWPLWPE